MAAKRVNGDGSVHHEPERNRWVGRLNIGGTRRKVTARTRAEVVAKMNKLRAAEAAGEVVVDGNTTFGDVAERWSTRVLDARQLAPSTRDRYRWTLELVVAELGSKRLRSLTVDHVEAALDRIAGGAHGRPLTRSSLVRVRGVAIDVLDFAVRRRIAATNVARLAELTASAPAERTRRSLTPAEAAQLWAALGAERLGGLFRLMLSTGLRPGEALGLQWDAVDLDAAQLTVRRGVRVERGRAVLVDDLKTAGSYRTIGLGAVAVDVLRSQRTAQAAERLAASSWASPELVFTSARGTLLDPPNVRRELAAICRRHELPEILPNELRHTAASLMNDAGVALELVADALGHTSTRMLDRHYRHRVRPSADAAMVLDRVLGG